MKQQIRESIAIDFYGKRVCGERIVILRNGAPKQFVVLDDRCVADRSAYASNQQPLMTHVALQLLWELAAGSTLRTCHPAKYGF